MAESAQTTADTAPAQAQAQAQARAAAPSASPIQVFPLPMYTTVPNEGSTFGVMPVFMALRGDQGIKWILAPSMSWNTSAGVTGTFRYYRYYGPLVSWRFITGASTNINRLAWFQYDDDRREVGHVTKNVILKVRRNIFYRFWGLGPNTVPAGESSYTRLTGVGAVRWGWNLFPNFNVGVFGEFRADQPELHAISGLPPTQVEYPDAPGIDGAMIMRQGLSIRYDTRVGGDYAVNGLLTELAGSVAEGLSGVGFFGQLTWQTRLLVQELSWLQLGARAYWTRLFSNDEIPFYYQASLGGELLLRGFPEDRFIDKGAWEVETEQRIRLLETHLFGVVTDWRIDPFVSAGQVYGTEPPWSHVRYSVGIGIRAWVQPNVLGRIDVAYGGEGARAYVVLGYPY